MRLIEIKHFNIKQFITLNIQTIEKLMLLMLMVLSVGFVVSCSDDDDDKKVSADKTELLATILEAKELLSTAVEGSGEGQYLAGSKTALETAVTAAEVIANNAKATQSIVTSANANLREAINVFKAKIIEPIAPTALVAHFKFDEGTGTSAMDASSNGFVGTLKTGHVFWGAGTPTWTADRKGTTGKALYLKDGAHVEVPYNTKLNPQRITIALWLKQDINDPIVNNQYMVSMNRWNGYKLNMQSDPKAFFTAATADKIWDHDNAEPILTQDDWYHVAVTFGDGHMIFYVNGEMVKDWDDVSGTLKDLSGSPVNLTLGQDLPNNAYSSNDDDPNFLDWGGFFVGALDEVRIYNTPLTGAQIKQIYDLEK
jgi:hypothetical protein